MLYPPMFRNHNRWSGISGPLLYLYKSLYSLNSLSKVPDHHVLGQSKVPNPTILDATFLDHFPYKHLYNINPPKKAALEGTTTERKRNAAASLKTPDHQSQIGTSQSQ